MVHEGSAMGSGLPLIANPIFPSPLTSVSICSHYRNGINIRSYIHHTTRAGTGVNERSVSYPINSLCTQFSLKARSRGATTTANAIDASNRLHCSLWWCWHDVIAPMTSQNRLHDSVYTRISFAEVAPCEWARVWFPIPVTKVPKSRDFCRFRAFIDDFRWPVMMGSVARVLRELFIKIRSKWLFGFNSFQPYLVSTSNKRLWTISRWTLRK